MIVGSPMLMVQQLEVKYDFLYDLYHVCCQELYATFILVVLFLLPLAAMLILYTRIGIELWIRKRVGDSSVLDTMNQGEVGKISRRKRRAIKMMITIVVLFTVCWAPFHTVHMLSEYNYLNERFHLALQLLQQPHRLRLHERELPEELCVHLSQCCRRHQKIQTTCPFYPTEGQTRDMRLWMS
ncbi:pyroglutamylated RF-amide peptide receptor-like isoform X2 [Coregonus clupeaformis]|uniref:pyroglutamylated RF-amide peptide receptor-like isoform X2 n=1 Tax=Coregonus clupeaformis TaxID=59861 RepID=UPI001E1C270D|nr:pyroglutamylated RF-amide peptide receptor-like isoform X2 [Coregonus clupeaformis]